MFGKLLNKGKCLVGVHAGTWAHTAPDQCVLVQVCERCQKQSTKIEHSWQAWGYQHDGDCRQARTCTRCRQSEERVEHPWAAPVYAAESACEQIRICARCEQRKAAGTVHEFTKWVYSAADSCTQAQACRRCGTAGAARRSAHVWPEWHYSPFYETEVAVCRRCARMVVRAGQSDEAARQVSVQDVHKLALQLSTAWRSGQWQPMIPLLQTHAAIAGAPAVDAYLRFGIDQLLESALETGEHEVISEVLASCRKHGVAAVVQYMNDSSQAPSAAQPAAGAAVRPPAAAPAAASPHSASPQLLPSLIGHWRCTESLGGGGISMSTDYHLLLYADGQYEEYSHSVTSGISTDHKSGRMVGRWAATPDQLHFSRDDITGVADYQVSEQNLFFPQASQTRFWERVS